MFQRNNNLPRDLQSLPPDSPQLSSGYLYQRKDSTQMAVSNYASGGASSYQSTHRHEMLVGMPNSVPILHSRSLDSISSMSSSDYQGSNYYRDYGGQMCQPILPYELRRLVCDMLDDKDPLGNDWRRLAAEFGLDACIRRFDNPRYESATSEILKVAQCQLKLESPQQLMTILRGMDRPDVANVIDEKLYTQPVDNQQGATEALPSGQRPALGYSAYQSPPPASMQGNKNQPFLGERQGCHEITSPPVASIPMRQSPDTPGSGTASVPESPMTPLTSRSRENQGKHHRGRNERHNKDESHISSSIGPSNVQPAEDDDTVPELQVDSGLSNSTTKGNQTSNANYRRAKKVEMVNNTNEATTTPGVSSVENLAGRLQAASLNAT